jgi:hypothetical protein
MGRGPGPLRLAHRPPTRRIHHAQEARSSRLHRGRNRREQLHGPPRGGSPRLQQDLLREQRLHLLPSGLPVPGAGPPRLRVVTRAGGATRAPRPRCHPGSVAKDATEIEPALAGAHDRAHDSAPEKPIQPRQDRADASRRQGKLVPPVRDEIRVLDGAGSPLGWHLLGPPWHLVGAGRPLGIMDSFCPVRTGHYCVHETGATPGGPVPLWTASKIPMGGLRKPERKVREPLGALGNPFRWTVISLG